MRLYWILLGDQNCICDFFKPILFKEFKTKHASLLEKKTHLILHLGDNMEKFGPCLAFSVKRFFHASLYMFSSIILGLSQCATHIDVQCSQEQTYP